MDRSKNLIILVTVSIAGLISGLLAIKQILLTIGSIAVDTPWGFVGHGSAAVLAILITGGCFALAYDKWQFEFSKDGLASINRLSRSADTLLTSLDKMRR